MNWRAINARAGFVIRRFGDRITNPVGAGRVSIFLLAGAALIVALPVALAPSSAPFPPRAAYSDLVISHWPNVEFVRRSLVAHGQLPLWNPNLFGGQPFAADPLAGLWYPPNWLLLALPLPFGFNLLFLLHLVWAGWGAFTWLRAEGRRDLAALAGALVFMGLPKLAAHYGAGHVGLVMAVAWTPWVLYAVRRAEHAWGAARLGGVFALLFLADVRWAVYAGLLAVTYWLAYSVFRILYQDAIPNTQYPIRRQGYLFLWKFLITVAAFLLLSAVLWLPLLEFVRLSSRADLTLAEASDFALSPLDLIGVIAPNFGGHHEQLVYLGWATVVLAVLGGFWGSFKRVGVKGDPVRHSEPERSGGEESLVRNSFRPIVVGIPRSARNDVKRVPTQMKHTLFKLRATTLFWVLVALLAALWSLGEAGGLFALAFRWLPGMSLLRVPPRAWFLVGLAVAWLAALGVESVQAGLSTRPTAVVRLVSVGVAALAGALAIGVFALGGALPRHFVWLAVMAALTAAVFIFAGRHTGWMLVILVVLDFAVVNANRIEMHARQPLLADGAAVAAFVTAQAQAPERVYSPSFSLPPLAATRAGAPQLEGVNPLHLAASAQVIARGTGVAYEGYSVVLPPVDDEPHTANAGVIPSAAWLAHFNVRWVASAFPVDAEGLTEVDRVGGLHLYENERADGWAGLDGEGTAQVEQWTPNRVVLRVTAAGEDVLRLAQPRYPGWQAWVDGEPVALLPERWIVVTLEPDAVQLPDQRLAVRVPPGEHEVEFVFRPRSVYVGAGMTVVGLALVALLAALEPRKNSRLLPETRFL